MNWVDTWVKVIFVSSGRQQQYITWYIWNTMDVTKNVIHFVCILHELRYLNFHSPCLRALMQNLIEPFLHHPCLRSRSIFWNLVFIWIWSLSVFLTSYTKKWCLIYYTIRSGFNSYLRCFFQKYEPSVCGKPIWRLWRCRTPFTRVHILTIISQ